MFVYVFHIQTHIELSHKGKINKNYSMADSDANKNFHVVSK